MPRNSDALKSVPQLHLRKCGPPGQTSARFGLSAIASPLCWRLPLEASSGRIIRHRLNRFGDRQLNRACTSSSTGACSTTIAPAPTSTAGEPNKKPTLKSGAASSATPPADAVGGSDDCRAVSEQPGQQVRFGEGGGPSVVADMRILGVAGGAAGGSQR